VNDIACWSIFMEEVDYIYALLLYSIFLSDGEARLQLL
jgi:hypothetical protein